MTPVDNSEIIAKLKAVANQWGGNIIEWSPQRYTLFAKAQQALPYRRRGGEPKSVKLRHFYEAPFTNSKIGINWRRRVILYAGNVHWVDFVHEMGHAFACRDNPDRSKEEKFFGWELKLVETTLGFSPGSSGHKEWEHSNQYYCVDGVHDLCQLTAEEKAEFYSYSVELATKEGLLVDGVPQCIRGRGA